MNKDVNKLLVKMVKYDLESGLFIALIIRIISTFANAGSYFVGISVAAINFFASGYFTSRCLGEKVRPLLLVTSYFFRMGFIVVTILPFAKYMNLVIFYIMGFVSHYIVLIVLGIKNRKGSV